MGRQSTASSNAAATASSMSPLCSSSWQSQSASAAVPHEPVRPASSAGASESDASAPGGGAGLQQRIANMRQTVDAMLAGSGQNAVGTTGSNANSNANATVTVDRSQLLQLRADLDALARQLNSR